MGANNVPRSNPKNRFRQLEVLLCGYKGVLAPINHEGDKGSAERGA